MHESLAEEGITGGNRPPVPPDRTNDVIADRVMNDGPKTNAPASVAPEPPGPERSKVFAVRREENSFAALPPDPVIECTRIGKYAEG
jgi:hypothetical protein